MNKNLKKALSYALGAILALGVGFSYAYAVGANDSNAFITTTEWENKVAQIEASLDNVSKTINDNNMDFVMNGPRMQVSLVEGLENSGGADSYGFPLSKYNEASTWNSWNNRFLQASNLILSDQWNGLQGVNRYNYYGGDMNGYEYACKARFAMRTNEDPNIYLIFSYYYVATGGAVYVANIWYLDISKQKQNYSSARSLSITIPTSDYVRFGTAGDIVPNGKTSSYLFSTANIDYMQGVRLIYTSNNTPTYSKVTNPGTAYYTVTTTATDATYTFEFPATSGGIRVDGPQPCIGICPVNMNGRKFGNACDMLDVRLSNATVPGICYKVFSPQKNCLSLKSYMNGEIPIFNE